MKWTKKTWAVVALVAALIGVGVYLYLRPGPPRARVVVAGNLPLTGPIALFCGQYPNGFSMGLDDACEEQGVPRSTFDADFQDNAGKPNTAVSVMQKQLLNDPNVYVSGTSAMSDAIAEQVTKSGAFHFLVSFDAFMTRADSRRYRILPNFKIEAPLFVEYVKSKTARRVFCFAPNLKAYLEQSDQLILPPLKKAGIEVRRELFEFETKDFSTLAEKADQFKPDAILVSGYAFHVYPILRALRNHDLTTKANVICTLDYIDLLHSDTPRNDLKGMAFVAPSCEIPGKVPTYEPWVKRYKERFDKRPSYVDAYAYDTARILVAAYKKGGELTHETLASVLPFHGVVGLIELDKERDLKSTLVVGYLNEEGKIEELKLP